MERLSRVPVRCFGRGGKVEEITGLKSRRATKRMSTEMCNNKGTVTREPEKENRRKRMTKSLIQKALDFKDDHIMHM